MSLELWNSFSRPPQTALKKIGGGRLKGMTDVNPQWRYEAMTAAFGPVGLGWRYTIDELWTVPGNADEILAFARVSLYVNHGGVWSEPIPGIGGNKLVGKESTGLHNNDEAYKMAVTDALSVAMKMLGVAAEIYLGNWDGSKYIRQADDIQPDAAAPPSSTAPGKAAFGSSAPPKKRFAWSTASSAERKDYVLQRIKEVRSSSDPVQALAKLKEISGKLKGNEFEKVDLDAVAEALLAADAEIRQECQVNQ